ncbi:MAG TPA: radical SAM protein [Nitrospiraceae bacterium]|jgi:radical SAM protein with 4Fe4S-binding SPASM domain|nr:radical SAM protein [Nitrospiraceae bacterium]
MFETRSIPKIEYKDFSLKLHERAEQLDRVVKAQLELTYRCNLHCVHCYTDPYNAKEFFPRELSFKEILRLIDEMRNIGIIWLNLTGGEIFMHPRFFDIYEYAYHKGFLLMLYSNGTLFTKAIIERLKRLPPFSIDVSCHSILEDSFEKFTQVPGSFRAFMRGMDLLKHSGLPFCFKTTAMKWNKEELPQIKRFIESLGQKFSFSTALSPRLNGDLSSLDHRLSTEEINALDDDRYGTVDAASCTDPSDWLSSPSDRLFRCGCATNTIHINAWGELGTCTLQYEHRASLRDYSLEDAIDKVFHAVRARRYQSDSPCRACHVRRFCEKKPSEAHWECGSAEAPIPYNCDVALARAERLVRQPLLHPLRGTQRQETRRQ